MGFVGWDGGASELGTVDCWLPVMPLAGGSTPDPDCGASRLTTLCLAPPLSGAFQPRGQNDLPTVAVTPFGQSRMPLPWHSAMQLWNTRWASDFG